MINSQIYTIAIYTQINNVNFVKYIHVKPKSSIQCLYDTCVIYAKSISYIDYMELYYSLIATYIVLIR